MKLGILVEGGLVNEVMVELPAVIGPVEASVFLDSIEVLIHDEDNIEAGDPPPKFLDGTGYEDLKTMIF